MAVVPPLYHVASPVWTLLYFGDAPGFEAAGLATAGLGTEGLATAGLAAEGFATGFAAGLTTGFGLGGSTRTAWTAGSDTLGRALGAS